MHGAVRAAVLSARHDRRDLPHAARARSADRRHPRRHERSHPRDAAGSAGHDAGSRVPAYAREQPDRPRPDLDPSGRARRRHGLPGASRDRPVPRRGGGSRRRAPVATGRHHRGGAARGLSSGAGDHAGRRQRVPSARHRNLRRYPIPRPYPKTLSGAVAALCVVVRCGRLPSSTIARFALDAAQDAGACPQDGRTSPPLGLSMPNGIPAVSYPLRSKPPPARARGGRGSICKGRTNSRPPWRSKIRPLATCSLNEEGARSGPFFVRRRS
jgi:hypothetical protein